MTEYHCIVTFRGRTTHRIDGYEPPAHGRMGAPRLACRQALPFWTDRFGNKVLHNWRAFTLDEPPAYNPCRTCWPDLHEESP